MVQRARLGWSRDVFGQGTIQLVDGQLSRARVEAWAQSKSQSKAEEVQSGDCRWWSEVGGVMGKAMEGRKWKRTKTTKGRYAAKPALRCAALRSVRLSSDVSQPSPSCSCATTTSRQVQPPPPPPR